MQKKMKVKIQGEIEVICTPVEDAPKLQHTGQNVIFAVPGKEAGDAIDFVAQLFGIGTREAAEKIAADFGLQYDNKAPRPPPRKTATKEQIAKQRELYTARVLSMPFPVLLAVVRITMPRAFDTPNLAVIRYSSPGRRWKPVSTIW